MYDTLALAYNLNESIKNEVSLKKDTYGGLIFFGSKISTTYLDLSYSNHNCAFLLGASFHHLDMPYTLSFKFYGEGIGNSLFTFENIEVKPIYESELVIQGFLHGTNPDYKSITNWLIHELRTIPTEIWKIKPKFDDKG